jgi:pseudoazurin
MLRQMTSALALGLALAGAGYAETVEVKMLNRGAEGAMVFEPAALRLAPGDTVRFIATDKSHNAETIEGMFPEGAVSFASPGFYGIRCKPHFAMGMVMVIAVGDEAAPPATFLEGRLPKKAKERLEAALAGL